MGAHSAIGSALRMDDTSWPVVVFQLGDGLADEDCQRMFDLYLQLYQRPGQFCPITDGRFMTRIPSAATRSLIAKLTKEHEPFSRQHILHSFAVAGGEITRGLLTAINWLSPPVYPISVLTSIVEAKRLACQALQTAGYKVPEALQRELQSTAR